MDDALEVLNGPQTNEMESRESLAVVYGASGCFGELGVTATRGVCWTAAAVGLVGF